MISGNHDAIECKLTFGVNLRGTCVQSNGKSINYYTKHYTNKSYAHAWLRKCAETANVLFGGTCLPSINRR